MFIKYGTYTDTKFFYFIPYHMKSRFKYHFTVQLKNITQLYFWKSYGNFISLFTNLNIYVLRNLVVTAFFNKNILNILIIKTKENIVLISILSETSNVTFINFKNLHIAVCQITSRIYIPILLLEMLLNFFNNKGQGFLKYCWRKCHTLSPLI